MNRVDRLFGLLLQLQHRRRVRAHDLATRFEVGERTIYRDMAALDEIGVPIVALPAFVNDPRPVLALLELLKVDSVLMVRRSVANNLNDIAKDHPDLVVEALARWKQHGDAAKQLADSFLEPGCGVAQRRQHSVDTCQPEPRDQDE